MQLYAIIYNYKKLYIFLEYVLLIIWGIFQYGEAKYT
jgi:hypothetical protein